MNYPYTIHKLLKQHTSQPQTDVAQTYADISYSWSKVYIWCNKVRKLGFLNCINIEKGILVDSKRLFSIYSANLASASLLPVLSNKFTIMTTLRSITTFFPLDTFVWQLATPLSYSKQWRRTWFTQFYQVLQVIFFPWVINLKSDSVLTLVFSFWWVSCLLFMKH